MKIKIVLILLSLSLSSYGLSIKEQMTRHLTLGYQVGLKSTNIATGENLKNGVKICDYIEREEVTLLSKEDGVYTFYIVETDNYRCEESSFSFLSIVDTRNFANHVDSFFKTMDDNNIVLSFDQNEENLIFELQAGDSHTVDLRGINTFEAFESILNVRGESRSGEYVSTHGPMTHSTEILQTLPDTSHVQNICDKRKMFDDDFDPERGLDCGFMVVTPE